MINLIHYSPLYWFQRVVGYGATQVVVPGNFPIGCFPIYLTLFQINNPAAYDEFHCLKGLNNFSTYHNDQLKIALEDLRKENPNIVRVYGDYYNAFQWVYRHTELLGESLSTSKVIIHYEANLT